MPVRGGRRPLAALLLLLLPGVAACGSSATQPPAAGEPPRGQYRRIQPAEARRRMTEPGAIVLDVRTPAEFAAGHIPGARLLPYTEIQRRAAAELPDREALVLVYCRSGARSAVAARRLIALGYRNVLDFGGIIRWDGEIVR